MKEAVNDINNAILRVVVAVILLAAGVGGIIAEVMGNLIESLVTPEMGLAGALILVIPVLFMIMSKMEGIKSLIEPLMDLISIFRRD